MADRGALLAGLYKRNALRRENGLPPLDIKAELEHEAALEDMRTVDALAVQYPDEMHLIEQQVKADLRAQEGEGFLRTMAGRFTINREVRARFDRFLREVAGINRGPPQARHPVAYGAGKPPEATG